MSNLNNVIIFEINSFVELTKASIERSMPGVPYTVIRPKRGSFIAEALNASDNKISLVVSSGVVVRITEGDLPPLSTLRQYHICAAREQVYSDHSKYAKFYSYLDRTANKKAIDLNVFIINPEKWSVIPEVDAGAIRDKKILAMPRYMNHKADDLVETCISPYEALKYGMLGQHAAILNYRRILEKGFASTIESYAYCLDALSEYCNSLPEKEKKICLDLVNRTTISNTRKKLSKALGYSR